MELIDGISLKKISPKKHRLIILDCIPTLLVVRGKLTREFLQLDKNRLSAMLYFLHQADYLNVSSQHLVNLVNSYQEFLLLNPEQAKMKTPENASFVDAKPFLESLK
ncbi:hypothetical protein [Thalassotalea agariperforans]